MAYDFFTSDLHLGHPSIMNFCNRPYREVGEMNARLIQNINDRCNVDDTLYHVGDFCCIGKVRKAEGLRIKPKQYEADIIPHIVHVNGNHDKSAKVKTAIESLFMRFGKFTAFVSHKPPWTTPWTDVNADFFICGHVHDKWKFHKHHGKLVINVGCDVWNYQPVRKDELLGCYERFKCGSLKV